MASENHGAVARGIERIFNQGSLVGLTEAQLLRRFATGDEGAFESLVKRLGPMVLGVCRRLLYDPRDVEDAFQATFLVLLRRAGSLRDAESLGPWLHGVASRVAARVRSRSARRPAGESKAARLEAVWPVSDLERGELRAVIDEEIRRLPEKYRRPVVLCYLEGRSHEEVARRLRCSAGSVRGRLDRARQNLRDRLIRRGVAPAAGLAALASGGEAVSAAVPAPLAAGTVATLARAATATAVSGAAPTAAFGLAEYVFRGMIVAKVQRAAWLVVGAFMLGALPLVVALEPGVRPMLSRPIGMPPLDGGKERDPQRGILVTGRVLDVEGRPIAGARLARGTDFRSRDDVPEVKSDADGRFTMTGVPPGPATLTVLARGHAPDLRTVEVKPGMEPVEFRLGASRTIRGRLVDAHGKPIADAPIAADLWRGFYSLRWSTRTDTEGRFRWDDAPSDVVQLDLGKLAFRGKRFYRIVPDAPEETLALRRPLRIRGRVTDARTGRPIQAFALVPGYIQGNDPDAWWENDQAREVTGLSYDVVLDTAFPVRVVRIEADGFLPAVSRPLMDDEGEAVVHFILKWGAGISGIVRHADGSPAAGAEVIAAVPSQKIRLVNGRVLPWYGHPRLVKARADGRFSLEPRDPPYASLALHDAGYAVQEVRERPAAAPVLTLRPWGAVQGILRIGRRPWAEQTLILDRGRTPDILGAIAWGGHVTTNPDGLFAFDRVVPGEVRVMRPVTIVSVWSGGGDPAVTIEVRPGKTAHLDIGGTGRPIVGQVVLPADLAARRDRVFGFCELRHKGVEAGSKVPAAPPSAQADVVRSFKVEPDGSFRIEDVEAGLYEMRLALNQRWRDAQGPGGKLLGSARRRVVVPEMPRGRSDEPLDLGKIPLTAVKSEAAPGASKP